MAARFKEMADFAEHPGSTLGGPADHYRVRLRVVKDLLYLFGRSDVAIGDHRYGCLRFDRRDGVVLRLAGKTAGARAPVDRQRPHTRVFGYSRDSQGVAIFAVPSGANLERHWHIHRPYYRIQYALYQRLVPEQRRPGHDVAYLLGRATHVDVDDLRALVDVVDRRLCQHLRIGARYLHGDGLDFPIMIGAAAGFF